MLKDIFTTNQLYFISYFLLLVIGGIALTQLEHGELLLFFSNNRTLASNHFFVNATKLGEELTYLSLTILFLFIRFRYALLIPLIGILVTLISYGSKSFFQQPRPFLYYNDLGVLNEINMIEGVNLAKGLTSFPSGHTMSAFALFTFIALIINNKRILAMLLLLMALAVGISRVYLVQHFLRDIYLGSIIGVFIAVLVYVIQAQYPINTTRKLDKKLTFKKSL